MSYNRKLAKIRLAKHFVYSGWMDQYGSKVLKSFKECDVEMSIYGAGINTKKVLKCFHTYHTDFHLLSLCQLWCEGSKYYVQGVFGDSEGNYQCLLLGGKRNTREQGILILPVLK